MTEFLDLSGPKIARKSFRLRSGVVNLT
jgi:hypothetical protein